LCESSSIASGFFAGRGYFWRRRKRVINAPPAGAATGASSPTARTLVGRAGDKRGSEQSAIVSLLAGAHGEQQTRSHCSDISPNIEPVRVAISCVDWRYADNGVL
jgi:hypothetical protein